MDVSTPTGHTSGVRLPPTPESPTIPLLELQFPGQYKGLDPTPSSRTHLPLPGSSAPNLGGGTQPLPTNPKLPTTEGKGRPVPRAKLPEGQRTQKPEDLEGPKVNPTSDQGLPTLVLPMEQKVSPFWFYE